ncbi:MAG: glycoside hydrolase family 28, partial [Paenibacillaceae bacterium]|nr:glycoside hydrolase family 28 [Paenibacillaceae bacterium]
MEMPVVEVPDFPKREFSVADYGAMGDGRAMNTEAFAAAIEACAAAGGGTVRIPAGVWLTAAIRLRSNINLHAEEGALVLFSDKFEDYPLIPTSYEGRPSYRCISTIYGENLENIAITGNGVFDGSGQAWRKVKKSKVTDSRWRELVRSGGSVEPNADVWWPSREAMEGEALVAKLVAENSTNPDDFLAAREFLRPVMVGLRACRKVLLDGPTFQNSPAWCLHPWACEHLTIRNVTVLNPEYAANGDGLDLDSCSHVNVSDSLFDVGDDAICLKSGRNEEGRRLGKPTQYVTIRNCRVYRAHGGFVVGSEMSGGV